MGVSPLASTARRNSLGSIGKCEFPLLTPGSTLTTTLGEGVFGISLVKDTERQENVLQRDAGSGERNLSAASICGLQRAAQDWACRPRRVGEAR